MSESLDLIVHNKLELEEHLKAIYGEASEELEKLWENSNIELKDRYNAAINNCLGCHKTECTGPIPKIKKLLIQ